MPMPQAKWSSRGPNVGMVISVVCPGGRAWRIPNSGKTTALAQFWASPREKASTAGLEAGRVTRSGAKPLLVTRIGMADAGAGVRIDGAFAVSEECGW